MFSLTFNVDKCARGSDFRKGVAMTNASLSWFLTFWHPSLSETHRCIHGTVALTWCVSLVASVLMTFLWIIRIKASPKQRSHDIRSMVRS